MDSTGNGSCALVGKVDDLLSAYQSEEDLAKAMDDGISGSDRLSRIVNREGRRPGAERSSSYVAYSFLNDLHQAGFGQLSIAFEYAMPGSSRRADAIVYSLESNTAQRTRVYMIVEFKDWTDEYIEQFEGFKEKGCQLVSNVEVKGQASPWVVKHPLDQAQNYRNYLFNFHNNIAKGSEKGELAVYSCCYIPRLENKDLIANSAYLDKYFPDDKDRKRGNCRQYVLTSFESDEDGFAGFFGKFWRPSAVTDLEHRPLKRNSEHYDELLEGKYSLSAKARKELKAIFQGENEKGRQPVILEYGNVAKLIAALRAVDGAFASGAKTVLVIRDADSNFGLILLDALLEQRYSEVVLQADGYVLSQLHQGRVKANSLSLHNAFHWESAVETEIGIVDLAHRKNGQRNFEDIIKASSDGEAKVIVFLAPDDLELDTSGIKNWMVATI